MRRLFLSTMWTLICPYDFLPLDLWVPVPAKMADQIKCCGDWNFKCWLQSHVCREAPAALSRNQKASANRAVLTLWPLANLFWHMGVLGLKNQNERKVFYHFSVIAGWTCPYTQPLPRMHFWKGVSDKHQNVPLGMSSGRALCCHWTMAGASSGSPAAQGWGQQTVTGAEWWKLGLGPAGDPTLHSSTLSSSCFVSYSYRQGEFRRPPASQAAEHSSITKVTSICYGLYQVWTKVT